MTGKRQRRLRRLVNRAARAWALEDRHSRFSMQPAAAYRACLRQMLERPDPSWARLAELQMRRARA